MLSPPSGRHASPAGKPAGARGARTARGIRGAGRADGAGHPAGSGIAASPGRLILSAFALSLDNLAAGFALGTMNIPVAEGAIVIGAVSVLLSLAGLELGKWIGCQPPPQ